MKDVQVRGGVKGTTEIDSWWKKHRITSRRLLSPNTLILTTEYCYFLTYLWPVIKAANQSVCSY